MLSLTQKRWVVPEQKDAINASHVLARLCSIRGIDPDATPKLSPPAIYQDMQKACERIHRAITEGERIAIFGDYDCDGVTAVAQLVRFFRRRGVDPFVRLPHRVRDGYGLSAAIVKEIQDDNIQLLITADTGITAVAEITALQESGIDTIVTDHHSVHEELPPAFAIVHPVLSTHPLPYPSGSGVAFTLIYALEQRPWEDMGEDLALAMCGTVADLVDLQGANRALVQLGLQELSKLQDSPLASLRDRCGRDGAPLTSTDVAFRIAPRINAAGRIAEPNIALCALLYGGQAIDELERLNEERKTLTQTLLDQAVETFSHGDLPEILVSVSPDYPHGIVGLIAGRLTEQFGRPSLVAHTDGKKCTASLRSPSPYDVTEGLKRCRALLDRFGGHAQAAGCTFAAENTDALTATLIEDVRAHTDTELLHPTLYVDSVVDPADITLSFCKQLSDLEPFGQGNRDPLFLISNVLLQNTQLCGGDMQHLRCTVGGIQAIGFHMAHLVTESQKVDILVRININEWQGKKTPQMVIEDMRLATKKTRDSAPSHLQSEVV